MNIDALKKLQEKATPGKLRIRQHPVNEDMFFLEADPYPGHPYHNVATGIEIGGEEDYPTKRADLILIMTLWNKLLESPYQIIHSVNCACKWQNHAVISPCGAHMAMIRRALEAKEAEDKQAEREPSHPLKQVYAEWPPVSALREALRRMLHQHGPEYCTCRDCENAHRILKETE